MSQKEFISWVLGAKLGLTSLAEMKINMEKEIKKLSEATPPEIDDNIKKSFLKFQIKDF